jgi:hypothetical protein
MTFLEILQQQLVGKRVSFDNVILTAPGKTEPINKVWVTPTGVPVNFMGCTEQIMSTDVFTVESVEANPDRFCGPDVVGGEKSSTEFIITFTMGGSMYLSMHDDLCIVE